MKMDIPEEIKLIKHWTCHKNKRPINIRTGKKARWSNPNTWQSFHDAESYYNSGKADGIGFILTKDIPYCIIDLDKCRNKDTGVTNEFATEILKLFPECYVEISLSGAGLHIIVKATPPGNIGNKGIGIEMYGWSHFFVLTGNMSCPDFFGHEIGKVKQGFMC
jgi:putative DNA primase/helicase